MTTLDPVAAQPLVGTRCDTCDRQFYPARDLCPTCWAEGLPEHRLPTTGRLATWTVVRLGNRFETPYALCYADFDGDVRVLGRVVNWTEELPLRPGLAVMTHAQTAPGDSGRTRTVEHTFTVDYSSDPHSSEA